MKRHAFAAVLTAAAVLLCLPVTVHANSSWHWGARSPLTVLPWLVLATLLIETLAVWRVNRIRRPWKPFLVVALANLLSFLLPYAFLGMLPQVFMEHLGFFERISYAVASYPYYTVGIAFLLLTLLVEMPVVYFSLRRAVENPKRLLAFIAAANLVSTILAAAAERVFCRGSW